MDLSGVEARRQSSRHGRQANDAVQKAYVHFGRLDIVLNTAGYSLAGSIEEAKGSDVKAMNATNIFGALAVIQAALPWSTSLSVSEIAYGLGFEHPQSFCSKPKPIFRRLNSDGVLIKHNLLRVCAGYYTFTYQYMLKDTFFGTNLSYSGVASVIIKLIKK